jgi:hypothetical protein
LIVDEGDGPDATEIDKEGTTAQRPNAKTKTVFQRKMKGKRFFVGDAEQDSRRVLQSHLTQRCYKKAIFQRRDRATWYLSERKTRLWR